MHLGLKAGAFYPMFCTKLEEPCSFSKIPDGPYNLIPLILTVQKKEPRYVCLSEAKTPKSHKMWTEVSFSVPHFLQMGLLLRPIIYRVSQVECAKLRENVPNVELHRYNPKHLYPKLNGYGDNGERSLKL
jgi:hypothetical protein